MNLLNKLSVAMARAGLSGLRNASEKHKDNLNYVKAVVKGQGPRSFQFASDWIRSDAQSLLEMVEINPEILNHAKDKIFDRYVKDKGIVEEEVDYNLFALKCLDVDASCMAYFSEDLQNKIIKILNEQEKYEGKFSGKPCVIDLNNLKTKEEMMFVIHYLKEFKEYR